MLWIEIRYCLMLHPLDHIVHSTSMVHGIELNIDITFLCITFNRQLHKDVGDTVYCIFLHISVIFNFHFYSLYMLLLAHRYGS